MVKGLEMDSSSPPPHNDSIAGWIFRLISEQWMSTKSKLSRKILQPRKGKKEEPISNLSDDILSLILSRIPLREAVRTSVLSKRWRYLWCSIPYLQLDMNLIINPPTLSWIYKDQMRKWAYAVQNILDSCRDPILGCSICIPIRKEFTDNLDEFVLFLCRNGIQDLYLWNSCGFYQFPTDAYFCQSLKKLTLIRCNVVLPPVFEGISCLTTLAVTDVSITNDDLERLISSCQLLESLCFFDDILEEKKFRKVRVSALNLLSLEIHSSMPTRVSLKTAPRLEEVFYKPFRYYSCNEAKRLVELLMNLGHVVSLKLKLFESTAKSLNRMKLPKSLSGLNLKKLTLDVKYDVERFLSCLLRSCSNLQELNIIITKGFFEEKGFVHETYWERHEPFECLMYHLTTVRINMSYLNNCCGIGFMEFLLKNAYVLKRMSIIYYKGLKEQMEAEISKLSLLQRASQHAVLEFKTYG
ncbi:F-box/LRR-repeat protein At3g26922-like [Tasmannia lanceolata]|uniref:F-box/LRR-repeat protein At3g26922-like n=1 Tax=Tasmannia lanceolata TaxID=3420 RepID=UPI0040634222